MENGPLDDLCSYAANEELRNDINTPGHNDLCLSDFAGMRPDSEMHDALEQIRSQIEGNQHMLPDGSAGYVMTDAGVFDWQIRYQISAEAPAAVQALAKASQKLPEAAKPFVVGRKLHIGDQYDNRYRQMVSEFQGEHGRAPSAEEQETIKTSILNDRLRTEGQGGQIVVTRGVGDLPESFRGRVFDAIKSLDVYEDFSEGNDPYKERDFGSVNVQGDKFFWKIDYYDKQLRGGSEKPSDPDQTERVMTVMRAEEY